MHGPFPLVCKSSGDLSARRYAHRAFRDYRDYEGSIQYSRCTLHYSRHALGLFELRIYLYSTSMSSIYYSTTMYCTTRVYCLAHRRTSRSIGSFLSFMLCIPCFRGGLVAVSPKPDLQSPLPLATVAETDAPGTWQSPLPLATVAETDAPGTWQARSTIYYSKVRYSTVQYSTVQYSTVQYSTVQYSTVQYSTVQYSTVQYSAVQ